MPRSCAPKSNPQRTPRVYPGDPSKLAAPSPTLTDRLLGFVARTYDLSNTQPVRLGGSFNLNVRIGEHVVRVYGPWVTSERVQEIQRVRRLLTTRGIPTPALRATRAGAFSCTFADCVIEVETYVAGTPMQSWTQLQLGMRTLGQLHTYMANLDSAIPPPIANHLPEELAFAATEDVLQVIAAWGPTAQEKRFAAAIAKLAVMLPILDLPIQLVHGDFKDNNVLFQTNNLMAVLDFDFMGVRPRIDDLALPLHTLLQRGEQLSRVRTLVDAYDRGCAVPLSPQERRALPFAMARMALSYLQYLMLPGDEAYQAHCRQEFNTSRGPACLWWLQALQDPALRENGFV
ncbi:MAG: phosphotransferase [Caldilineaceae bacterium]